MPETSDEMNNLALPNAQPNKVAGWLNEEKPLEAGIFGIYNRKNLIKDILKATDWGKIRNEILIPVMNEMEKGIEANRDSISSYMHKATNAPNNLINDALTDYFRKLGD